MARVTIGPLPASSARAWLDNAERALASLRENPDLLPTDVTDRFAVVLAVWRRTAETDPFVWEGDVEPAQARRMAANWLRLATLARERPDVGLAVAPAESEAFYEALVAAIAEVTPDDDRDHFGPKFQEVAPPFAERGSLPEPAETPIRVIVVDDTSDIRLLVRFALERDGRFDVVGEAADGQEAIDACLQLRPDVVVLDIAMPVMDGLTALPILREQVPEACVVLFTAAEERGLRERATALGAASLVSKTETMSALATALAEATLKRTA